MQTQTLVGALLIVISPAVGSFVGVLADRLPRGEDVVRGGSACRSCNSALGWREMVPLLSYAWQRGRCRTCGATIPRDLPLTELAALGLAVAAVRVTGDPAQMILGCGLLWCLLALFVTDLRWFRLPDTLTATLFVIAIGLTAVSNDPGLAQALIGAGLGSGVFLALRLGYRHLRGREGLGLGDVKLMAGVGAAVGAMQLPMVLLIASLTGLAWALLQRLILRTPLLGRTALPFGSFLCLGCVVIRLAKA